MFIVGSKARKGEDGWRCFAAAGEVCALRGVHAPSTGPGQSGYIGSDARECIDVHRRSLSKP